MAHRRRSILHGIIAHVKNVKSVNFSRDGSRFVSISWDSTIKTWESDTGTLLAAIDSEWDGKCSSAAVFSAIFSPDSEGILSTNGHQSIHVRNGKNLSRHYDMSISGAMSLVAFSPDGWECVCASQENTTIHIHDTIDGSLQNKLIGHSGGIVALAFSADGIIASASIDYTYKLWEAATGNCLHTMSW